VGVVVPWISKGAYHVLYEIGLEIVGIAIVLVEDNTTENETEELQGEIFHA
jgi:hypothetical protein